VSAPGCIRRFVFQWLPHEPLIDRGGGFCNSVKENPTGEDDAMPELHREEINAY
jgi:hypothetical protein